MKKILLLELWGIGDVVLASGVLKQLKRSLPKAEIVLLAKEHSKEVLFYNSGIDRIIAYDFPWTKFSGKYLLWRWDWISLFMLIRRLRSEKFDLILDARGDVRNNFLSFLIGAKRRIGYDWTGGGCFLTDVVRSDREKMHRVDAWGNLLKYIGIENCNINPAIAVSEEYERWAEKFLQDRRVDRNKIIAGIHPGARIKTRCWPLDRFSVVADYLRKKDCEVFIFIEPGGYGEDIRVPDGCHKVKLNLHELIALTKRLDFLICNDSGIMHISTAVGTPVVAIFGPMKPEWFGPYGGDNLVIIKEDISCRPCFDYCKYDEARCLTAIHKDEVIDKVEGVINKLAVLKNNHAKL